MKKLIRLSMSLFAAALLMSTLVVPAKALSIDDAWIKILDGINTAQYVASNNSLCMNLAYVGSSTEAVVTITKTDIQGYAPGAVLDANFGLSGSTFVLNSSAYDTMGELCDAIDGLADYKCTLLGCKRSDNSNLLRDQTQTSGTNDLKAAGGFDVKFDTGSDIALTAVNHETIGLTPLSGRRIVLKQITCNINVIGTCDVYGKLRRYENANDGVTRNDTTQVWSSITADDTDKTVTFSISGIGGLEFAKDAHVVVDGTTPITAGVGANQAAANYLLVWYEER